MKNTPFNLISDYVSEVLEAGDLIKFDGSYLFHSTAAFAFDNLCTAVDF